MSESSLLDEVPNRVLGPPEDDPPVTVTERDKVGTWRDVGLGEQPEGKIDTAVVVDAKLSWFPKHEESVALSPQRAADRLEPRT